MLSGNAAVWVEHFRLRALELRCFLLGCGEALAALVVWIGYALCPWTGLALVGEALVLAALVAFVRAWWCNRRLKGLEGRL